MFPFSQFPQYSYHNAPPSVGQESEGFFLQHHHQDLLSGHSSASIAESIINMAVLNSRMATQDTVNAQNLGLDGKKPMRKDRHSKISTAQGLRDRRVRLSIKIAREFFDLQDMLGFDKASKTLEWLLAHSKKAINDLAKRKHRSHSANEETDDDGNIDGIFPTSKVLEMEMKRMKKVSPQLSKESRDKARARARERTREKLCIHTTGSQMLSQLNSLNQLEAEYSASYGPNEMEHQAPKDDNVKDSITIKGKLKMKSSTNDYNNNVPDLPQNWGISNSVGRLSFYATSHIVEQTSNEFQINGKWGSPTRPI